MKKDYFNDEEKVELKAVKKAALVLGLAGIMAGSFVACGKSGADNSASNNLTSSSSEIEDSISSEILPDSSIENSDSSEKGDSSSSVDEIEEIPYEAIQDFVAEVGASNYTYIEKNNNQNTSHIIDGEKMYVSTNGEIGNYYYVENGQMYKLSYDKENRNWEKTAEENLSDFNGYIYDTLIATDWESYDKAQNIVSGSVGELDYSLDLDNGVLSGEINGQISEIGNSEVVMPHSSIIVDKTQGETVESANIYEVVDGEYVFDIVAIKDVLLNWMQGDNQFGKDISAIRALADDCKTKDIIYVKASPENLAFGTINELGGQQSFKETYFNDDTLYNAFASEEVKTKEDFKSYLNAIPKLTKLKNTEAPINFEYSTQDENYPKEEFDILTNRAFERLENKGTQGNSINNDFPTTKLEGFSEAEVLFGFKTRRSGESAGYDMGFGRGWNQYYILKYKDHIEFLRCTVISSTSNNVTDELQNVLNNNENWWMISVIQREELNNENEKLYEDSTTAILNNKTAKSKLNADVILMNKKEREFC